MVVPFAGASVGVHAAPLGLALPAVRRGAGGGRGMVTNDSRAMEKLLLALEILEKQKELWTLRAKAKKIRIAEVKRQIETRRVKK